MKENEIDRILAELFAGENISEEDRHVLEEWKRENGRNERFEEELQDLKEFSMGLKGRRDNRGVFEQIEKIVKKQREKFCWFVGALWQLGLYFCWVLLLILCFQVGNEKWRLCDWRIMLK